MQFKQKYVRCIKKFFSLCILYMQIWFFMKYNFNARNE